jgi:hypothetical protein
MNKWFDKTNLASYAKTALLQAQKKIDQVLDIKEDEILLGLKTQQDHQQQQQQIEEYKVKQNGYQDNNNTETPAKSPTIETEDFFSSFLGENNENKSLDLNSNKSNQIELIASTTSLTSSITSEYPKVTSNDDLLLNGDDFRNNKLINKEKQDWIQNYLDDNDNKKQQEEFIIENKSNIEDIEDVGTSVDDIELITKKDQDEREEGEGEENKKKEFNDFIKISGNSSSNR